MLIAAERRARSDLGTTSTFSRNHARVGIAVSALLAVGTIAAGVATIIGHERSGFAFVGLAATLIVWLPLAVQRCALVSAWSAAILVVSIGCGARGLLLTFTGDADLLSFFLTDKTFAELFGASVMLLLITTACTAGYLAGTARQSSARAQWFALDDHLLLRPAGTIVIAVQALLGLVGSLLYIRAVGGFSFSLRISERRTTISTLDLDQQTSFQSFGHWEYLASLSLFAFAFYYARLRLIDTPTTMRQRFITILLLANALLLPFFSTTRGSLLTLVFVVAAVGATRDQKVRASRVVALALVAILAASTLLGIRRGQAIEDAVLSPVNSAAELPASLLNNRNMADLGKSLLVIDATDGVLERANGATIGGFAFAVIPRSVWADKPLVSPGPIVGTKVFGTRVTGVPPGGVSELVWNFGRVAALPLAALLGLLIGAVDSRTRLTDRSAMSAIFLALISMQFTRDLFGVSIGKALLTAVLSTIILAAARSAMRVLGDAR